MYPSLSLSIYIYIWVYTYLYTYIHIYTCMYIYLYVLRTYASADNGMGWLQLVGSLKLDVSFVEYRLFYRVLLQKRPILLRSLLIVATPYVQIRVAGKCRVLL